MLNAQQIPYRNHLSFFGVKSIPSAMRTKSHVQMRGSLKPRLLVADVSTTDAFYLWNSHTCEMLEFTYASLPCPSALHFPRMSESLNRTLLPIAMANAILNYKELNKGLSLGNLTRYKLFSFRHCLRSSSRDQETERLKMLEQHKEPSLEKTQAGVCWILLVLQHLSCQQSNGKITEYRLTCSLDRQQEDEKKLRLTIQFTNSKLPGKAGRTRPRTIPFSDALNRRGDCASLWVVSTQFGLTAGSGDRTAWWLAELAWECLVPGSCLLCLYSKPALERQEKHLGISIIYPQEWKCYHQHNPCIVAVRGHM